MEIPPHGVAEKPDRKTVERNRRSQMKALYTRLDALVRISGPAMALPDRLEEATLYIKRTQEKVEGLKERKRKLMSFAKIAHEGEDSGVCLPKIEVQDLGSGLHVILVSGGPDRVSFHQAVRAVEEAGGEVLNAHFSVVGAKTLYTIHTSVGEQGDVEMVVQRLKKAVHGDAA